MNGALMTATVSTRHTLTTTQRERSQASELAEILDDVSPANQSLALPNGSVVPPELLRLLRRVTDAVATGQTITIGTLPDTLTTSAAAELVGISRPTLMKLVAEGTLPAHKVGSHTRLKTGDVIALRRTRLEKQRQAFDDLRGLEAELGIE